MQTALVVGASLGLLVGSAVAWLVARHLPRRSGPRRLAELDRFHGSHRDALTGLPNRQSFAAALTGRLLAGPKLALVLLDLDGFAALNSVHGYRAADEALVAAAARLRAQVPDIRQLGRLCGDEFAIILDLDGQDAAEAAVLPLLREMAKALPVGAGAWACSVSIGVALSPAHGTGVDALLGAAKSALDHAKEGRGGAWRIFDPTRGNPERARTGLKDGLLAAIEAGEILPYYQPIVELSTGAIVGLEVLARWAHPERGLMPPELFVPLAEEMGVAGQLTQTLMRRVIADLRAWPSWLTVAFNVSPGQLRELIAMIRDPPAWPEGVLDPQRLEIELTESEMIEDLNVAREVIGLLQVRGTRVVLDDFGIGTSNLCHLRDLPFDRIKVDRSFIVNIGHDPRAEACVRAMLALSGGLGMEMVAEGIESAETAALLARLGCRFGQGSFYAQPVPASGVSGLLRQFAVRTAPALAVS